MIHTIQRSCYSLLVVLSFISFVSTAQQADEAPVPDDEEDIVSKVAPKVYMDCDFCDLNFLRQEVNFINYVRDPKLADIHVLVTRQFTGGGGKEHAILFIGQNDFAGMNDTLMYLTGPDDTEDEIGSAGAQTLKIGLMYYIGKTPLGKYIKITYDRAVVPLVVKDKWDNWVFEIDLGTWFSGEESYSDISLWSSINASRITEKWKIELDVNANYREEKFKFGGETITSVKRSQAFDFVAVKSLGEHFSTGLFGRVNSSLYKNISLKYSGAPGLEYNLFAYAHSARKQLRIVYKIDLGYVYYNDSTIYEKIEEELYQESLGLALELKQKWGSVRTYVMGSHYFDDINKNRLKLFTRVSVRLFKGFTLRLMGSLEIIHDQLSLAKESGASREDVLLRQSQQATQYDYWGNIGFTYTFGSIYNNVVNPRFGN